MISAGVPVRERAHAARESILAAAERLFAEHGMVVVPNRPVSEAAEQGDTAAADCRLGGETELVRAIVCKHVTDVARIRTRTVAEAAGSTSVRDWPR